MNILIIDNNVDPTSWGSENLVRFARKTPGATITVRRGPHDDLPRIENAVAKFDRLVMSGSKTSCLDHFPWVGRLEDLVRAFVKADKPVLGVCYGHQILSRALGGRDIVRKGSQPEFGWTRITQTLASPLLKGLPETFISFSSHYEEVSRLAPGFVKLAHSEACGIQAVQLQGKRVFGIQFHPEKNILEAEEVFQGRRKDPKSPPLMGDGLSEKLFDPKVGEQIFGNFYAC